MGARRNWAAACVLALALAIVGSGTWALAAQSTPVASPTAKDTGHPAHIHDGTCAKLGAVVYPLKNLTAPIQNAATSKATPKSTAAAGSASGAATPTVAANAEMTTNPVVAKSTTTVNVALASLLKSKFAVNVHESTANIQNYIACGDITGKIKNGKLTIKLKELNKSGFEGEAVLTEKGSTSTTVVVTLTKVKSAPATPTAATPVS